jgi:hypothetical protein
MDFLGERKAALRWTVDEASEEAYVCGLPARGAVSPPPVCHHGIRARPVRLSATLTFRVMVRVTVFVVARLRFPRWRQGPSGVAGSEA